MIWSHVGHPIFARAKSPDGQFLDMTLSLVVSTNCSDNKVFIKQRIKKNMECQSGTGFPSQISHYIPRTTVDTDHLSLVPWVL